MAHSKSPKKRVRQNERRRLHNRTLRGRMRTAVKAAEKLTSDADAPTVQTALSVAASQLDRAARKRLIHPNAAARKKSRLAKRVLRLSSRAV